MQSPKSMMGTGPTGFQHLVGAHPTNPREFENQQYFSSSKGVTQPPGNCAKESGEGHFKNPGSFAKFSLI